MKSRGGNGGREISTKINNMSAQNEKNNIMRDLGVVALSIVIAIILAKTGALAGILTSTQEWTILGSLVAGIFFVSIFTAAPAGVVLFELAAANPIWEVALFGGIGALIGDLLIFRFIKDSISADIPEEERIEISQVVFVLE